LHVRHGSLAQADRNMLYIGEINMLSDDIVDAILDTAPRVVSSPGEDRFQPPTGHVSS